MPLPLDNAARFTQRMYSQNDTGGSTPHSARNEPTDQAASEFDSTLSTMNSLADKASALKRAVSQFSVASLSGRIFSRDLGEFLVGLQGVFGSISGELRRPSGQGNEDYQGYAELQQAQQHIYTRLEEITGSSRHSYEITLALSLFYVPMFESTIPLIMRGYAARTGIYDAQAEIGQLRRIAYSPSPKMTASRVVTDEKGSRLVRDPNLHQDLQGLYEEVHDGYMVLRAEADQIELTGDTTREVKNGASLDTIFSQAIATHDVATVLELLYVAISDWDRMPRQNGRAEAVYRGLKEAAIKLHQYFDGYIAYYANEFYRRPHLASGISQELAATSEFQTIVFLYFLVSRGEKGLQPIVAKQLIDARFFPALPAGMEDIIFSRQQMIFDVSDQTPEVLAIKRTNGEHVFATFGNLPEADRQAIYTFLHGLKQIRDALKRESPLQVAIEGVGTVVIMEDRSFLNIATVNASGEYLLLQVELDTSNENASRNIYGIPSTIYSEQQTGYFRFIAAIHRALVRKGTVRGEGKQTPVAAKASRRTADVPASDPLSGTKLGDREARMAAYAEAHQELPRTVEEAIYVSAEIDPENLVNQKPAPETQVHKRKPEQTGQYSVIYDEDDDHLFRDYKPEQREHLREDLDEVMYLLQQELRDNHGTSSRLMPIYGEIRDLKFLRAHVGYDDRVIVRIIREDSVPVVHVVGFGPKSSGKVYDRLFAKYGR